MREIAKYVSDHTSTDAKVDVKVSMFFDDKSQPQGLTKDDERLKEIDYSKITDKMSIEGVGYKVVTKKGHRTVLITINWVSSRI